MTLTQLLSRYLSYRIVRPATVVCYTDAARSIERFCDTHGLARPEVFLSDITTELLLLWRQWVLVRNAPTSFNKHRRHLRALLRFAVADGLIARSPLDAVGPAPVAKRRPKIVPSGWYRDSIALLASGQLSGLNPTWFWRLALSVLHFSACRRRQLVELRWRHVLWARGGILLASEGSKSRKEWEVPLPRWLMSELQDLRRRHVLACGHGEINGHQVFCLPLYTGRHRCAEMRDVHVADAVAALGGHLGYKLSPHRIRHTSATKMLEGSRDLKSVSLMLGHSDVALTANTYVHPAMAQLRRAQRALHGYSQD
jgi:integrase